MFTDQRCPSEKALPLKLFSDKKEYHMSIIQSVFNPFKSVIIKSNKSPSFLTASAILIGTLLFLYFDTLSHLIAGFFSYGSCFGLVILAISICMIWIKRDRLSLLTRSPMIIPGTIFTLLGCFMLIIAKLSSTLLLQYVSLVVTLIGLIFLLLGYQFFKALCCPVLYLLLMFPLPEEILGNFSTHFQTITAWIASTILSFLGMPVFIVDHVIQLPHITLKVARACNGINHVTAVFALGVPLAFLAGKNRLTKAILLLFALGIAMIANGVRVALIGLWTAYFPGPFIHGPFNLFYSGFILLFGVSALLIFTALYRFYSKPKQLFQNISTSKPYNPHSRNVQNNFCPSKNDSSLHSLNATRENSSINFFDFNDQQATVFSPKTSSSGYTNPRLKLSFALALLLLLASIFYLHFHKVKPVPLHPALNQFPTTIDDWVGINGQHLSRKLATIKPDSQLHRIYKDSHGNEFTLYIAYFAQQRQDKELVHYDHDWLHYDADTIFIPRANSTIPIKKTTLPRENTSQTLYFWHQIDNKILVDRYKTKALTLMNAILKGRTNGALVLLALPNNQESNLSISQLRFINTLISTITSFINTSQ
jgi:EpsI family protein